jgi:hypothetical protein
VVVLQIGVGCVHWPLSMHPAQPIGVQIGPFGLLVQSALLPHGAQWRSRQKAPFGLPVQSIAETHCTQRCVVVLHTGVAPLQSVLLAQNGTHISSAVQMSPWGQSVVARHCTQACRVGSQTGAAIPQSWSLRHAAQDSVVVSQIGADAGQSLLVVQPTQTPCTMSQIGARGLTMQFALLVQAGEHRCVVGEHLGAVAGQLASTRHSTQVSVVGSHSGRAGSSMVQAALGLGCAGSHWPHA